MSKEELTEEEMNAVRRQAEEDKQANYQKLVDAGIKPTEKLLHDMMYESLTRRLYTWIKDRRATDTTPENNYL
ncbi:MAG TPA: hypothetical protein VGN34_23905 [Ktedonobacteraceae bacterium]